ncbi:putative glycoside hydrolase [Winogradskyella psychrotolerans]|uniref:putative glycoside hydrolase n=1 Tax=Winogradskyella psychrotolerans TaxID=1344585 RepID=UPI001C0663E2|nr:putative glycoside hydrolase [Winogradskyella psychrotolerans]MBU2929876.1 putative glycoside hydrolase family 15 protein [Winogradskyella psychrotolerans]
MKKTFLFILLITVSVLHAQDNGSKNQSFVISDGTTFTPKDFFPKFSWDTTPMYYMFQHKQRLLKPEEVDFIAARTDFLCIEKSHGKVELGAAELGAKHESAAFKEVKPDAKVLFYFNSAYAWPYTSYSKNFTKEKIEDHPELKKFLLTNPETGKLYEHYGAFCFDLLNPDFREWWVDTVVKGVKESSCDGVFIDQMHGNSRFRSEKKEEIAIAMGEMMAALKDRMGADKILLGNNANNEDAKYVYPVCDAVMFENYATVRSKKENLLSEWQDMLKNAQNGKISVFRLGVEGAGRGNLKPRGEMPKFSQKQVEFSLACYLIGAQPYSYFMYSWGWTLATGSLVNYPELQKPLGAPKGAYKRTTPEGWEFTREFEHASVWVDTENRKAKITWH